MNVSIIIPKYRPDKKIYKRTLESIKKQKFSGKIEVIETDESRELSVKMNKEIKRAKYEIIVTLHQDCVPTDENWLSNLISPFSRKEVVATVSRVHLPEELWNTFGIFAKAMTLNEKGVITPLLDLKGCAYRKKTLEEVGLFDDKKFETAGEDFDMYLKLKEKGEIVYPNCEILHYHSTMFKKRAHKAYQYGNGFGALVRIHGSKMPRWYIGLAKAIPLIGILPFFIAYPFNKGPSLYPFYLLATPFLHYYHTLGFWKGFLRAKQTV